MSVFSRSPQSARALALAATSGIAVAACGVSDASPPRATAKSDDDTRAMARPDPEATASPAASNVVAAPATPSLTPASSCAAPSVVRLAAGDDARGLDALASCSWRDPYLAMCEREQPAATRCGLAPYARAVDVRRMLEAAVPFDAATRAHVRAVAAEGRAQGRRADVFGVVGDSMSIDRAFLRPFSARDGNRVALSPLVREALRVDGERTIVDVFRGVAASREGDESVDSFRAPRAARVGALAAWATASDPRGTTPVSRMIEELSPAYAIVMFGTNDAANRIASPEVLAHDFEADLARIVDALEARGVIAILTTIPKHMRDKHFADCPVKGTPKSNLRFVVQTNAISAAVAALACERHLPLIDLRWALDPLLDHGVGKDGVHPSRFYKGGGLLDDDGLQCGYNAKNLVTLRMLADVHAAAFGGTEGAP